MKVAVRFFASIREALGAGESVDVAEGATLGDLRDLLIARGGEYATVLARGRSLRSALDQNVAAETVTLRDGAEVAFFPPVTGG